MGKLKFVKENKSESKSELLLNKKPDILEA